jgi:hypothetical protein
LSTVEPNCILHDSADYFVTTRGLRITGDNFKNLTQSFFSAGGPCHPWLFLEEAASKEVERDFNSVYSRLVLCKTYRLDEDGKVLTPEEVSVTTKNMTLTVLMKIVVVSLVCSSGNKEVHTLSQLRRR